MHYDRKLNQIFADYIDEELNFPTLLRVLPSMVIPAGTVFAHKQAGKRWLFQTLENVSVSLFTSRRYPIFIEPGSVYPEPTFAIIPFNNTIEPVTRKEYMEYMRNDII